VQKPTVDTTQGAPPIDHAAALAVLGGLMLLATVKGASFVETFDWFPFAGTLGIHTALYVAAVWLALRRGCAGALGLILLVAIGLRGIALTAPVNLTTDILRYVWDGRIQLAGFSPYLYVPADPALAEFRGWEYYGSINQKDTSVTIYPPVAEMIFAVSARLFDSIDGMRLVMTAFDLVTIAAIIAWLRADGLPDSRVLIYAWHPLPVWEFASSGHIDSAATALLTLAIVAAVRGRQGWAGAALGAAVLTKYFPIVLAPALWRRFGWRMPAAFVATVAALYIPYWYGAGSRVIGFLFSHLDNEGYGAGFGFHVVWVLRDFGLADIPGRHYTAVALAVMGGLGLWALVARRTEEIRADHLVVLAAAFIWLTSPHYPWYFGWMMPLLARWLSPSVLAFSLLALLQNLPGDEASLWFRSTTLYLALFGTGLVLMLGEVAWRWRAQVALTTPSAARRS